MFGKNEKIEKLEKKVEKYEEAFDDFLQIEKRLNEGDLSVKINEKKYQGKARQLAKALKEDKRQAYRAALPSKYFELDEEIKSMMEGDAKVQLQERTKELDAIKRSDELFGELDEEPEKLVETYVQEVPNWL